MKKCDQKSILTHHSHFSQQPEGDAKCPLELNVWKFLEGAQTDAGVLGAAERQRKEAARGNPGHMAG